jgi:hypothetical protein
MTGKAVRAAYTPKNVAFCVSNAVRLPEPRSICVFGKNIFGKKDKIVLIVIFLYVTQARNIYLLP